MTFQAAPLNTTDNAPGGPKSGKPMDAHLWDHVLVEHKMEGAPAPFNIQTPPKTTGRPL